MAHEAGLQRFIAAQEASYPTALAEIRQGRKQSHWMWYIFPQIAGLGFSETSKYYALKDLAEAAAYLAHPVLGNGLTELCQELLALPGRDAHAVFGSPDDVKLRSSMTLFALLPGADPVFEAVLEKYFRGAKDEQTLRLAGHN